MKILLITPPLLQPNTPYAATPLLTAWLKSQGHEATQIDLSLQLLLRLFSKKGILELCTELETSAETARDYAEPIDNVIAFLQDRRPELAQKITTRGYLPEGTHLARAYEQEAQLRWNFRGLETADRARHLASLYLDDLAEAATALDPNFGFSRYAEKLAASLPDFRTLQTELETGDTLFIDWLEELTDTALAAHHPERIVLTVPFPGCLMGALIIARHIRQTAPAIKIILGGGYPNTELRELTDPTIFDYVDAIALDSGFLPLQRWIENGNLVRTFIRKDGQVDYQNTPADEIPHNTLPPPDYSGLELQNYFGLFEQLNPVTRLWSDGKWNKLMLAHGCCWSRCAFCDTTIDYVCRYDPATPKTICNWIEATLAQTHFNGFHFVDEALPPNLLDGLCDEIQRRNLHIEWWGNIRFEKHFTPALIQKMVAAGCIAVTGGLETACDRTLQLMRKGITMSHATRVLTDLAHAGILTHAYLMYGFPTQTPEETLQALETIRQLFDANILHSAYWHRFALTAHSHISTHPQHYNITLLPHTSRRRNKGGRTPSTFARNEIPFKTPRTDDLEALGKTLKTATYNYMLGLALDQPIESP